MRKIQEEPQRVLEHAGVRAAAILRELFLIPFRHLAERGRGRVGAHGLQQVAQLLAGVVVGRGYALQPFLVVVEEVAELDIYFVCVRQPRHHAIVELREGVDGIRRDDVARL